MDYKYVYAIVGLILGLYIGNMVGDIAKIIFPVVGVMYATKLSQLTSQSRRTDN